MYDELIKKIRHCATDPMHCLSCGEVKDGRCFKRLMTQAADAIEELMRFAHFVAQEVVVSDEKWENNEIAFPEIASRKLHKIGIVEKDGAFWHYEPPKEEG